MDAQRHRDVLNQLKDLPFREKQLRAAGVITDYVKKRFDINLIVVGGLSVELYTDGGYATQDIDFVGANHKKILQALTELGFENEGGKDSSHEELEIFVEIPGAALKDAEEKYVKVYRTEDGFDVRVIGIEDIIKDRLRAYIHWKSIEQREWTYDLIKRYYEELDIPYIQETLDESEWDIFQLLLDAAKVVDKEKSRHLEMQIFMDREGIPYSEVEEWIFAFPIQQTYYGFSLYPESMGYEIPDDADEDVLEPIQDEMTTQELINWFNTIEWKHTKAIVDELRELYE